MAILDIYKIASDSTSTNSKIFADIGKKVVDYKSSITSRLVDDSNINNVKLPKSIGGSIVAGSDTSLTKINYPDDQSVYGKLSLRGSSPDRNTRPFLEILPYETDSINARDSWHLGSAITRDVARIGRFMLSNTGLLFAAKQFALQALNPTIESKVWNPLSLLGEYTSTYGGFAGNVINSTNLNGVLSGRRYINVGLAGGSKYFENDSNSVVNRDAIKNSRAAQQIDQPTIVGRLVGSNPNRHLGLPFDVNLILTKPELVSAAANEFLGDDRYQKDNKLIDDTATNVSKGGILWKKTDAVLDGNSIGGATSNIPSPTSLFGNAVGSIVNKFVPSFSIKVTNRHSVDSKYIMLPGTNTKDSFMSQRYELRKVAGEIPNDIVREGSNLRQPWIKPLMDKSTSESNRPLQPVIINNDGYRYQAKKDNQPAIATVLTQINTDLTSFPIKNLGDIKATSRTLQQMNWDPLSNDIFTVGNIPVLEDSDPNLDKLLTNDLIKFSIEDIVNKKVLLFRAHIKGLTDTTTPVWNENEYIGRPDMALSYKSFTREIAFTLDIPIESATQLKTQYQKLNWLMGLCYPAGYQSAGVGILSPIIKITIGDWLTKSLGAIQSLTITVPDESTWETIDGYQLPQWVSVDMTVRILYNGLGPAQTRGFHLGPKWITDTTDRKTSEFAEGRTIE